MTQAQLDLQTQLDSLNYCNVTDRTTTPVCNSSPFLFLESMEHKNFSTHLEHAESTNTLINSSDKQNETRPGTFTSLSFSVYLPIISTKTALSTERDDDLILTL